MLAAVFFLACSHATQIPAETAKGFVFHDQDGDGQRGPGEPGIAGVSVSNGDEVTVTDADGAYSLSVGADTILFVVKPAGWRTPHDHNGTVARFYYIHKPAGSPQLKFGGVPPTGPLPAEVNFALTPQEEPEQFDILLLGDPQPRNRRDVDFLSHDVYEELMGTPAALGASLGDLVFDGLDIFPDIIAQAGLLGIPWLHVIGNHDINFDAREPRHSDETFERLFGPSWYAANFANMHVLVLNNIWWMHKEDKYEGRFGDDQLAFVRNNLDRVDKDKLIVVMMHIPLNDTKDADRLLALLAPFPNTFSLSAHTHVQAHRFLPMGPGDDAPRHHHLNLMTSGGSWMRGQLDELGIPHTTMRDGGPNGYAIMAVNGNQFSLRFKAARRPADYQMDIHAPEEVRIAEATSGEVVVNYFYGNEFSKLEMRLGDSGDWIAMEQFTGKAPYYVEMFNRHIEILKQIAVASGKDPNDEKTLKSIGQSLETTLGRIPPDPVDTAHLWRAKLPAPAAPGNHTIQVRAQDMWGAQHSAHRIIRVLE